MTLKFWQSKRVFITGHTGFKGSWLSLLLHTLGAKICGYSLPAPTHPSLFKLAKVEDFLESSYINDVCDLESLKKAVLHFKPDLVFHLAAQSLVRYSYDNPLETYQTNILGTVNILEAMRASNSAKVFVNVTTDKCYENKNTFYGYRESDPLGGYDPYSSSKACSEIITAAYRSSYFTNTSSHQAIATTRAGNVIGGGDWAENRLVPDVIMAYIRGKKPIIRNPLATRPWQHVLEPLYGYLMLAEKLWHEPSLFAESWNFGPDSADCQSVAWVANMLNQFWGENYGWQTSNEIQPHESKFLALDISKARTRLHWKPQWNLTNALEATVLWYRNWFLQEDILNFSLKQINQYAQTMEEVNA